MSEQAAKTPASPARRSLFARSAIPIGTMAGALSMIAIVYLGYDLAKGELAPCEAIFQQTSVGLSTRISFLKTEGELQIGRDTLTELDDRGKMAALNLKTCCTVLDAGRLDPEQFLQCKGQARAYESRVADIVALVRTAVKESITTGAIAASASTPATPSGAAAVPAGAVPSITAEIEKEVEAARNVSRDFNTQLVQVRKEQALERLEATPPKHVTIEAQEREPNNNALTTNVIELGKWVTGSIGAGGDSDYFTFTTPGTQRDWIRMELQNGSTTLEPRMRLYDAEKTAIGDQYKTTSGADLRYGFVSPPGTKYIVRVSNYYGKSSGVYLMRVLATEAYDAHEPNEDILHAKQISVGMPVKASIMDGGDGDYFKFTTGGKEGAMVIMVANLSTTLRPQITLFDANKTNLGQHENTTSGGDVSYPIVAKPKSTYYVRVRDYYGKTAGDYTLTVTDSPPGDG